MLTMNVTNATTATIGSPTTRAARESQVSVRFFLAPAMPAKDARPNGAKSSPIHERLLRFE
jgi:hypothetical protein